MSPAKNKAKLNYQNTNNILEMTNFYFSNSKSIASEAQYNSPLLMQPHLQKDCNLHHQVHQLPLQN